MLTTFNTIGLYTLFCNKWPEKTKVIGKTGLVIRRETPRDPVRSQNHHLVLWDPALRIRHLISEISSISPYIPIPVIVAT